MTLENYKSAVKDMDEKEMIDDLEERHIQIRKYVV